MKTLFIAWQDGNSGAWFPIGRLTFDGREYKFAYTHGLREAQTRCGFQPLLCFPNQQEVYTSPKLFPLFSNRVRSRSPPDYPDFAQWLNMSTEEYDPIALLSRSGGQRALVMRTEDKLMVGNCPPYLLDDDSLEILQQQPELVKIHVDRVNSKQTPLQFRLLCHMRAQWPHDFSPFSSQMYRPICPDRAVIMA